MQALQRAAELLPQEAEAQDNLANALLEQNRPQEALVYYQRALALKPGYAQAHSNMGQALQKLGRLQEAQTSYLAAIEYNPKLTFAYENLGDVLREEGQFEQAALRYEKALHINPKLTEVLNKLGVVLSELTRNDEALACYQKVLALQPSHVVARCNMGNLLRQKGQLNQAIECYQLALQGRPDFVNAHINLGLSLHAQRNYDQALACYQLALGLKPDSAEAHNNCGNTLAELDRLDEAVAAFEKALAINPKLVEAYSNMGNALHSMGLFEQAQASCREALKLDPDYLGAHINLAVSLLDSTEAMGHFHYVLEREPQNPLAQFNLSLLNLALGNIQQGWIGYEYRFSQVERRNFPSPTWAGEDLSGKTLLIWGEQGVGDEIFFASLFGKALNQAQRCVIECRPKLQPLFARSFAGAVVVASSEPPHPATANAIDYQCAAGSLGRWLCPTLDQMPRQHRYLTPDAARLAYWRARIAGLGTGLKIGICWRSSSIKGGRAQQYSTLEQWGALFHLPGVHFVNLQYDECTAELEHARQQCGIALHHYPEVDMYDDLDETSALIASLDVVIGAGTAVTALSAALGVPTCQMSFGQIFSTFGTPDDGFAANLHHFSRQLDQNWTPVIEQIAAQLAHHGVPVPPGVDIATYEKLGDGFLESGQYAQAVQAYRQATINAPEHIEALNKLGVVLSEMGEVDDSLDCYRQLLAIQPGHVVARCNLGHLLRQKGQLEQAIECFELALQSHPNFVTAHINLGLTYQARHSFDLALGCYQQALALNPNSVDAKINLGNALREIGRLDEAISCYESILALSPNQSGAPHWVDAHLNLGVIMQETGQHDVARRHLETVLQIDPHDQRARFNLGLLQLRSGQLAEGWAGYEHRFVGQHKRPFPQPFWSGEELDGKALLIWGEQGIGDEIFFASGFNQIIRRTVKCVIECAPKLQPLFANSFPNAQVVARSSPPHQATVQGIDLQCPSGSLARWLYPTINHLPKHRAYLIPAPDRCTYWRQQFDQLGAGLKIGFCWRSSLTQGRRRLQYSTLEEWRPLFEIPHCHFINLQYDDCSAELAQAGQQFGIPLHAYPEVDMHDDLDETAALIQSLDYVVTAGTAVAALAGALGVPTWVMSYGKDWTMLGTDHDAFSASLCHVFRESNQNWGDVIAHIAQLLQRQAALSSIVTQ